MAINLSQLAVVAILVLVLRSCSNQLDGQAKEINALRDKVDLLERRLNEGAN